MTSTISLRTGSMICLATWAGIWLLFLLMRFSPFDIRSIPGIGIILLVALAVTVLAPIAAIGLAGAALARGPRLPFNWRTLGYAVAALCGQALLFFSSRWL